LIKCWRLCTSTYPLLFPPPSCLTGAGDAKLEAAFGGSYSWTPSDDPVFFPGRQAKVLSKGSEVGRFGIIHPEVGQSAPTDWWLLEERVHGVGPELPARVYSMRYSL
jgi:hypothetical protein